MMMTGHCWEPGPFMRSVSWSTPRVGRVHQERAGGATSDSARKKPGRFCEVERAMPAMAVRVRPGGGREDVEGG
jgi:hypothetical protein